MTLPSDAPVTDPAIPIATAFIASHEGFRSAPYKDTAGKFTIGYGFTFTEDGKPVTADTPHVTQEAAYARLQDMVVRVVAAVRTMVYPAVTDSQLAALASFAFNAGTYALRHSKLLLALNQGKPDEAATHFAEWVYAGGKYSPGLAARRADERALFLTADEPVNESPIPLKVASAVSTDVDSADALNARELARVQA